MPLFFVPLLGLMGIEIALLRRAAHAPVDGPHEDAATRMLRWAIGLLARERAEWGRAMVGELGHIHGRIPRMRFVLGCVAVAVALPPWGRRPPPSGS